MTIFERIKKAFGVFQKSIEKVFTKDFELAYPEEGEEYKSNFFKYVRHFQKKFDMKKEKAIKYTSEWLNEVDDMEEIDDMDDRDYIVWVDIET